MPSPSSPYIVLLAPLNYSEASSGDIDTFTAYTDAQGNLAHYAWVMNQSGANIWTASINSPSDSADVIQLSIPTGYAVDGYSLSITSSTINSSALFDFGSNSGGSFDDFRALASFSSNNVVGAGTYSITIGSGTNVLSYTLQLNMIKVNEAPTITEDALYPTFYTGGAPADLFSNVVVSNEAGQHITQMTLTVYDVVAADSEFLTIGNADIRLADGQSGTLSNGVAFTTTDSNGSIVVSLVMPANTTSQTLQALLDGMTYKNTSASPTLGDRYIELTSVSDDGGTAKTGIDTGQLGDYATVTVAAPLNAAPVVTTDSGSAAFNETAGGTSTPVTIDASLTVIDSDNTTLLSAKVSVSNHFNSAQDVLLFTNNGTSMGDISGSYDASTGVLNLTSAGSATVAQWQEALRSIAYSNSSHDPDTSPRTISYVVNDGTSDSAIATRDVTLTAANDAPVLTTTGATTSFTEGNNVTSTAVVIDSGLSLGDIDNLTLASATVAITSGGHSAEDTLGFSNNPATMGNILASYHAATGVLDLTSAGATATLAQWQAALRSVTYSDSSDTPNTSTRTISFTVNDGAANSNFGTKSVSVTGVNDAPIATVSGGSSAFTEGADATSTPVIVDGGLTVSDLDSVTLSTAKVSITTHFKTAEDKLLFVNDSTSMGNISGVYHADTGVLDLASSGSTATLAQWQAALRSVAYTDTSDTPDTNARTITFVVNDGSTNSAVVQKTVTVTAANDAPVVSTSGGEVTFTPGNNAAAVPVIIDKQLTVSDPDNATLASATVAVTGHFNVGDDVLSFTNNAATMGNISGSYNGVTGILTLSSAANQADLAQWQSALRSVTYTDNAIVPNTDTRTISFTVNDSQANSTTVTKDISVATVDQSPVLGTSIGDTVFTEGQNAASTPVVIDSDLTVSDVDGNQLVSATISIGNHTADDLLAFVNDGSTMGDITQSYNAATGVLTLSSAASASLGEWQNALRSVTYSNSSDTPDTTPRDISFVVNDGGSDSVVVKKTVTVTSVNDAPVVVTGTDPATFIEGHDVASTPVAIDSQLHINDVDNGTLASAKVSITGNLHSAEDLLAFTGSAATGNIIASYDALSGVLSLSSADATATLSQWQTALQSVTYSNSSDNPSADSREISFVVNDGTDDSLAAVQTVGVLPANDSPTISAPPASTAFTEGDSAVVVNGNVAVADVDDTTLQSAKVAVSHYQTGEDRLALAPGLQDIGDITASFNALTGELSLTSATPATLAQWKTALSSVTYENISQAPSGSARTITFTVNDGEFDSNVFSQTVDLFAVNDAPEITLAAATQSVRQDTTLVFNTANHNLIRIDDVDAGSSEVQVTLSTTNGSLTLGSTTGLTVAGNGQDSVLVTGTLAAINAGLNGLKFAPTTGFTGSATINVSVNDQGLSAGYPDPLTADTSLAITITPTPTTPVTPPVTVDGVPVTSTSVTLPDGETGSSVSVGLVTDSRVDSTGNASTADIDLVGSGSGASLSAKLPVGYGLTAAAGAVKTVANSAETLKAAIDAVTANTDQAHQNVNGQHFLDKLADGSSLLVTTVTPVTASTAPTQALELDGSSGSQLTALVIDAGQMGGKGSLVLNNVDFAAVVGQATVQGNTTGQVLTGDDASQSFIVNASDSFVFAGGGSDTLQITSFAAANNTVLQGGQGNDTVQFSGNSSLYNIEQHGGFTIVSSKDDPNQQVKVVNVESLSFADGAVSIPTDTQQTTLAALYEGLLGRQADVAGFDYWTQQSLSIGGIGLSILNSTEAGAKALNGDTSHDIAAMYTAFFGRAADAAGQAYWTEQVQQGHLTFVQVADSLLTSAEMASHNKAPATWDFTV
ncbi:DUF4214 domain-containing protein [Pseudomonas sp. NPDC087358]|uniref:DUF4214 domain-containing protein n=1 Tax=Pseudomonas sp. NPDC087358 TaxID=3364439 RepID=UPI00384CE2EB